MKVKRKIIEIDDERCDGCGNCILSCAEGALRIVDGKARVISDHFCDGLGACLGECPQGALQIVEREAEEFDEKAVEAHLKEKEKSDEAPSLACGCPSSRIQQFVPCEAGKKGEENVPSESALTHWPVQIRLVPPDAPFLKGADLVVVADCVPIAFADFHREFLNGKAVMMGCPKFDDKQAYVDKFTDIFRKAGIRRITTVTMEVPCCAGLPHIVKNAMEKSGARIPVEEVVISTRGKILRRFKAA